MKDINFYRVFKDDGLKLGWKHAKKDFFFFLQVFVLVGIASAIPMIVNWIYGMPFDTPNFGDVISTLLSLIFSFGMIKIFIHFVRKGKADLKDLRNHDWVRFLRWFLTRIVTAVLIGVGMVLLIVPGIYVAARLYLYEYYVVDQKLNTIEAISASWEVTKGHVWQIIGIGLLSFGILLLGTLALGIGLLWAIPTVKLAQATLYKKLTSHDEYLA